MKKIDYRFSTSKCFDFASLLLIMYTIGNSIFLRKFTAIFSNLMWFTDRSELFTH